MFRHTGEMTGTHECQLRAAKVPFLLKIVHGYQWTITSVLDLAPIPTCSGGARPRGAVAR